MASTAKTICGTGANDASIGTRAWGSVHNITTDSLSASGGGSFGGYFLTNYIKGTNFGFAIPTGATIDGIEIHWRLHCSHNSGGDDANDNTVKIVKGGTITGDNKARSSATKYPTSVAEVDFGGSADLWGETWSESDIEASDFGSVLAADLNQATTFITAFASSCKATIHYTEAATGGKTSQLTLLGVGGPI